MIMDSLEENKVKYYLYMLFGKILMFGTIILSILLKEPMLLLSTFILLWVNVFINDKERKNVKSQGLIYLRNIIVSAKKIQAINDPVIEEYNNKIKDLLKELKVIDRATRAIQLANTGGGVFEVLTIPFLLEETAFYRVANLLDEKKNNYIMSIYKKGIFFGLAVCDISTGEFYATQINEENNFERLLDEISRFSPAEIIANDIFYKSEQEISIIKERFGLYISKAQEESFAEDYTEIQNNYEVLTTSGKKVDSLENGLFTVCSINGLLNYLTSTQKMKLEHIHKIEINTSLKKLFSSPFLF